jgi:asparagine synthase (glutamine-hydrolysing)
MCGISGVFDSSGGVPEVSASMRDAILFRGRDAQAAWSAPGIALAQARLAIIDPYGGDQPMTDETGRFTIVYSGEVYNYRELREQYERAGARFRTQCDTEVVLEGFRLKGREVCRELNGMFAFAVWDAERRELVLARDGLGKKPLFWYAAGGRVWFSSTLDAFTDVPGWTGALSHASLALYTALGSVPADRTVYEQGRTVPAGCTVTVAADHPPAVERYWRLQFGRARRASAADVAEEYEELLVDAIRLRLRSDVPLALTFSGGVDSGTIAALCAQRLGMPLTCYTVDHHTPEDPSEETRNAERAARELGVDWRYIHYDYRRDVLDELQASYAPYDQPSQQLALVYSRRLYQSIRPHATVVLSGNGSDELFTGYMGDEAVRRRDLIAGPLRPLAPLLARTGRGPATLRLGIVEGWAATMAAEVSAQAVDPAAAEEARAAVRRLADEAHASGVRTFLDFKMWADLSFGTVDANYRLPDISGLEAQVEVRSPFLDQRMVEFAARLPPRHKVARPLRGPVTKALPKRAYARMVSADIAYSRKKGMGSNIRWDRLVAGDAGFHEAFADAYAALDDAGIASASSRSAWERFRTERAAGRRGAEHGGRMMAGFMLGRWLRRTAARGVTATAA